MNKNDQNNQIEKLVNLFTERANHGYPIQFAYESSSYDKTPFKTGEEIASAMGELFQDPMSQGPRPANRPTRCSVEIGPTDIVAALNFLKENNMPLIAQRIVEHLEELA